MPSLPQLRLHLAYAEVTADSHDALVVVDTAFDATAALQSASAVWWAAAAAPYRAVDQEFGSSVVLVPAPAVGGGRLVLSPTGSLDNDTDDVRKVFDAVKRGVARAIEAGASRPTVLLAPRLPAADAVPDADYSRWVEVALLAALDASYVTLVVREHRKAAAGGDAAMDKLASIDLVVEGATDAAALCGAAKRVAAIESGRRLALDMGYGGPERMTPYKCAATIEAAVAGVPGISYEEIKDLEVLKRDYPLLYNSARASFS
ncbi:hypothetical protein H4R19_006216, partial [Coemansia spiralis]